MKTFYKNYEIEIELMTVGERWKASWYVRGPDHKTKPYLGSELFDTELAAEEGALRSAIREIEKEISKK